MLNAHLNCIGNVRSWMVIEPRKHNLFLKTSKIIQHKTSSWQEKDYKTRRYRTAKLSWRSKHSKFEGPRREEEQIKDKTSWVVSANWWTARNEVNVRLTKCNVYYCKHNILLFHDGNLYSQLYLLKLLIVTVLFVNCSRNNQTEILSWAE